MRVLFIHPVPEPTKKIYTGYSVGIGSLAAAAKAAGHVSALYTPEGFDRDALLAAVRRFDAQCVGISVTSPQMALARRVVRTLDETTGIPVIAGGVGVTVAPGELRSFPNVVAEVMGEGERALPEMLTRLESGRDLAGIANVHLPGQSPPAKLEVIEELDALAIDDREIFDYQAILDRNRANVGLEIMASRGCPFGCGYCANRALNELTGARSVRTRGVGHVMRELDMLTRRYDHVGMVGFHDDIFALDKDWLVEFAPAFKKRVGLPFWCNLRIGTFTEDDLSLLGKAGCFRVHIGVESGSERIRRDILNRPFARQEIIEAFRAVRGAGLKGLAFFMLGLPTETENEMNETIRLAREIKPDWSVVSLFTPYPGTALAEVASAGGFPSTYYDDTFIHEGAAAPPDTVRRYYRDFVRMVYPGV